MRSLLAATAVFLACSVSTFARERDGVTMPDQKKIGGKTLVLNGLGTREATVFKVDVYVGGLYLETPTRDAQAILASPQIKHVDLKFVRDVSAKDIREAWMNSAKNSCAPDCGTVLPKFEKLNGTMEDIKKGEMLSFSFLPGKTEIEVKGKLGIVIEGADFSRVMLSAWIGPNPPNTGLKEGMLGSN
jgi:hypothetical protein